jgi:gamma-glutamyl-gamma-aminobutyraldehyde dehydrogenase
VPAVAARPFLKASPIDGRALGRWRAAQADIDAAVASARSAFDDGRWAGKAPAARKRILQRFCRKILAAKDELALLETLDMGKPIQYSLAVDVPSTARCIAWYAEAIDKVYDEIAPTAATALALITREPMGVIGCIVPWNYPMIMAAWKLGPALATGNSVVLKPSEKSPFTALRLAELAMEAGMPPGVFNVVPGYGHEAGEALALHMDVDAIGFTGSTRTGRRMLDYAGRSNLKRVYNELGGKSAFVVFDDFANVERAAAPWPAACSSTRAKAAMRRRACWCTKALPTASSTSWPPRRPSTQPADPLDAGTVMGALVDETQLAPCWATSTPAAPRARAPWPVASGRARPAAATTSSPRCSTG